MSDPPSKSGLIPKIGALVAVLGLVVTLLATFVPEDDRDEVLLWAWRIVTFRFVSVAIDTPSSKGTSFDRCVFMEKVHHCERAKFTRLAATEVCNLYHYQAAVSYKWEIRPVDKVLIWDGYNDGMGSFRVLKKGDELIATPAEPNPGQKYIVDILGVFTEVSCV